MQALSPTADEPDSVEQLIERLRDGNLGAEQAVREAGEAIGIMVATLCNVLNPRHVIVGGLIVSQALTLYTTPVVFIYLDRLAKGAKRLWRRYYLRAEPGPIAGPAR